MDANNEPSTEDEETLMLVLQALDQLAAEELAVELQELGLNNTAAAG